MSILLPKSGHCTFDDFFERYNIMSQRINFFINPIYDGKISPNFTLRKNKNIKKFMTLPIIFYVFQVYSYKFFIQSMLQTILIFIITNI